jgi:putrescine---pyruvate transaminase
VGADRVAAFIGEPVQGAGGVIIPPETYWPEIQRICDRHGILLISRRGDLRLRPHGPLVRLRALRLPPDLMTLAKGSPAATSRWAG